MNEEQREHLLDALINTNDLRRRFHHQADFHHAVQLLVRSLPKYVEFLAQSSDETERERAMIRQLIEKEEPPCWNCFQIKPLKEYSNLDHRLGPALLVGLCDECAEELKEQHG